MKRIIFTVFMILVFVAGTLLTGCGEKEPAPTPPAPKPPVTPAPAPTPPPAPEGPKYGGILRVAVYSGAPSYDSQSATTMRVQVHTSAVFSGLIRTDPMKAVVSVENMVPDLAESWDVSSDNLTYTFKLRKGVKFHDGEPFTAEDVKYSLDKFRDKERSAFAANVDAMDSVEIVDDYTVKIHLKYLFPDFLVFLAPPYCSIVPEHLKDVDPKSTDYLVGTGPFRFKEDVPGKVTVYERNPDYFLEGLPYLDGYEVYYMEHAAIADAFIAGQLDTCGSLSELYYTDFPTVEKVRKLVPERKELPKLVGSSRGVFSSFVHEGPWQDKRVRQAMRLVINFEELILAYVGTHEFGYEEGATLVPGYLPEALPKDEIAKIRGTDLPMEERIKKAKQLMADAGYANGFEAELIMRAGEIQQEGASLYCMDQWKKHLNINVTLTPLDRSILYPRRDTGDFELCTESVATMTGSLAYEQLNTFITGARLNVGKWSNAEYDALVAQYAKELDTQKRIEIAYKAQRIWEEEVPFIIFAGTASGTAWRPDLRTGWPNPLDGIVAQPLKTCYNSIDRIWFANTPDAERWQR